jgi:hypothetical protein
VLTSSVSWPEVEGAIRSLRILAARLSGIGWEGDRVSGKDPPALFNAFRQLGVPEELVVSTGVAVTALRVPIAVMVPLVWLAAHEEQVPTTMHRDVPCTCDINGVPAHALDTVVTQDASAPALPDKIGPMNSRELARSSFVRLEERF